MHCVHDALHLSVLTLKLAIWQDLCIAPGHISQSEDVRYLSRGGDGEGGRGGSTVGGGRGSHCRGCGVQPTSFIATERGLSTNVSVSGHSASPYTVTLTVVAEPTPCTTAARRAKMHTVTVFIATD